MREDWYEDAACANLGPGPFFVDTLDLEGTEYARSICRGCPVRAECLEDALGWPYEMDLGIRAGLTEGERKYMDRTPKPEMRHPGHGTKEGYTFEVRNMGETCQPCRDAEARRQQAYKENRKRQQ